MRVGERHAAVGPVERLVDTEIAAADAVDTQAAAKRRVLGRDAMLLQGLDDGIEFRAADDSLGIGAASNLLRGIIEAEERVETVVAINPGHLENA